MRVGHGFDAHRLGEGRELILGGVRIEHERGLIGHSDADALTHAVIDALLGASGLGDIGLLFPDTDPKYEGISSIELLRKVRGLLDERGYTPVNVDCTVLAEAPRLSPYRTEMETVLAEAMDMLPPFVHVKFTTEEGMGYTGAREGIAAHAVVLIE